MPVTINGTTGFSSPDGHSGAPSLRGTDSDTGIFFPATDHIAFTEGGTEVLRIDSSANVGIGTTNPTSKLHTLVNTNTTNVCALFENSNIGGSALSELNIKAGTNKILFGLGGSGTIYNAYLGADQNQPFAIFTRNSYLAFETNNGERLRITNTGSVGIGTTNPSVKLHVQGNTWLNNYSADTQTRAQGLTVSFSPGSNFTPGADPGDTLRNTSFMATGSTRPSIITLRNIDNNNAFYDLIADGNTNSFYIQRPTSSAPPAFTINSSNNIGIRNSSPDCTLSVGTGNIRMASGYSRMVTGFKSANASSFTMFDIVGIFREDLTELIIKHGHEGGGMHGSYRRWIFTSNAGNTIQTFEDTNNINYGGGNGFSFSWPSYGTLRITWGGASLFSESFYLACWIRCRNNISFTNQGMDSFSS